MFKKFTCVILITLLLLTSIYKDVSAIAPLALTPAVKYAIGAGLVAGGAYASDNAALDHIVEKTWDTLSTASKRQWNTAVTYGSMVGHVILSSDMWDGLKSAISSIGIGIGSNNIVSYKNVNYDTNQNPLVDESEILDTFTVMGTSSPYYGKTITSRNVLWFDGYIRGIEFLADDKVIYSLGGNWNYYPGTLKGVITVYNNQFRCCEYNVLTNTFLYRTTDVFLGRIGSGLKQVVSSVIGSSSLSLPLRDFVNPFTGQRTIEVPPVPPDTWDSNWLDELEKELNKVGNPDISETEIQEGWSDWWIDKDGTIYKNPKGDPPKKEDDVKLVPPVPLPEIPDKPWQPPTEIPDKITEKEIEPPEITEVPHPTKPDTTIRTTTRTIERTTVKTNPKTGETTTTTETVQRTTIEEITYARDGIPLPEPETEIITETETDIAPPSTTTEDATNIDWEPLKVLPQKFTWKFPFSLPWDLMRAFKNFEAYGLWDAKIPINFKVLHIDVTMELDLNPYTNIANLCKSVQILFLDIALILATRRLLGGAA